MGEPMTTDQRTALSSLVAEMVPYERTGVAKWIIRRWRERLDAVLSGSSAASLQTIAKKEIMREGEHITASTDIPTASSNESQSLDRPEWITAHLDHGGTVTKREHYDECTCGATYWRDAAVPRPPSESQPKRVRSEEILRNTLSMLCNFVWTHKTRPGEHMWSIPADTERDFDCILLDAIDELVERRAADPLAATPAPPPENGISSPVCVECGGPLGSVWYPLPNGREWRCGQCFKWPTAHPRARQTLKALIFAERILRFLVTEDEGSGSFVRGTGTEIAGFGAGMTDLRAAIQALASPSSANTESKTS